MGSRIRSRDFRKLVQGRVIRTGIYDLPREYLRGTSQTTTDVIGNLDGDNPFNSDTSNRQFMTIDGMNPEGSRAYVNCPLLGVAGYKIPSTTEGLSLPNTSAMTPIWLGLLTPQAEALSVPQFLGEMKDIPAMLTQVPDLMRFWGRMLLSKNAATASRGAKLLRDFGGDAGGAYLGYRFGWAPLMRDLAEILGVQAAIMANLNMLMRLRKGRSIKRSLRLAPQIINIDRGTVVLESQNVVIRARVTQVNSCKHWVTSRWEPLFPGYYRRLPDQALWNSAVRSALGLTPGGALDTWWELLPWSWLIDWFARVQAQLARFTKNNWLLRCTSLCYMRTSQVHVYFALAPSEPWAKLTGKNLLHRKVKLRVPLGIAQPSPSDPSPPALPALSGSQMGILSALAAQKAKGIRL